MLGVAFTDDGHIDAMAGVVRRLVVNLPQVLWCGVARAGAASAEVLRGLIALQRVETDDRHDVVRGRHKWRRSVSEEVQR